MLIFSFIFIYPFLLLGQLYLFAGKRVYSQKKKKKKIPSYIENFEQENSI